ncbi:MAG: Bug family tripartite tricarboxylate transporter substrate binding protein [Burkholderiales bacterium]
MTLELRRRQLLLAGAALAVPSAHAQSSAWPTERPIRIIVPFAPGGSTDVIARLIADEMRSRVNQTMVVENRPGAGSTLGTGLVAKAPPDGYTLLVTVISAFSVGSTLYRGRIDWDPDKSFAHIGDILRTPYALMANRNAPYGSVAEFIAHARRNPGTAYATSGVGSIPHLVMLRLAQSEGIQITHVPYRGGAQAVVDVIGGQVPLVLDGLAAAVPHLKTGALKGLGVTSASRSAALPELATFVEQGVKDGVVEGWAGLAAPAGTPRPALERLAAALREAMALPNLQERYRGAASTAGSRFLDDMQRFVRSDAEAWRPIVLASGATPDG